jgi:hypothetical protein
MAAAWRSKWMDWQPGDEIIPAPPKIELTEPTEPGFVSSVSSISRESQNTLLSGPRPETLREVDLLPAEIGAWDRVFLAWASTRCAFKDGCSGGVHGLYADHVAWAHASADRDFAPGEPTFVAILMALGFSVENGFVHGLLLREDIDTKHWPEGSAGSEARRWRPLTAE